MTLYLIVIGVSNLLLWGAGMLYTAYPWWQVILAFAGATVAAVALDGLTAWVVRLLPESWFSLPRVLGAGRKEMRFYRRLGIRKWKEKVPELGMFTHFSKRRVERPGDAAYLERYIMECNYGAVGHLAGALAGFLLLVCMPLRPLWLFALPVALINAVLSLMPLFVLRYNLPALRYLHSRTERKRMDEMADLH